MERRENRRMQRNKSGAKAKSVEVDAIAVALTAQIIICVLILLIAQITRMSDEERFVRLKQEYATLISGSSGMSIPDYFAEIAGITGRAFEALENFVGGLVGRQQPQSPMPEPEPQPPSQSLATGGDTPPVNLSIFPARSAAQDDQLPAASCQLTMRPAPTGSTLAPYFLSRPLSPPVAGIITSPFAFRIHPISGSLDFHNGVDIAAPTGQEILAALPGQVERVGECEIYGKYVLLRHAHNLGTFYAHASQILVSEGASVFQGERIAKVGATGRATGPHLHFAVIVEGMYADPLHGLARYIRAAQ